MQSLRMHSSPLHQVRVVALAAVALAVLTSAPVAFAAGPAVTTAPLEKAPQSAAMADSVVTVDSLIRTENQQALAHAREQAVAAGLLQPESPKTVKAAGPVASQFDVQSIYGIENDLRANVVFNGELYERIRVGVRVGACVIAAIDGKAVILKPVRKGVAASQCPIGIWTGVPRFPQMGPAEATRAGPGGAMPSPAVPSPFGAPGQAGARAAFPSAPGAPVQGMPGSPGPAAQPAVSLVPRQAEPVIDPRLQPPAASNN